MAKILNGKIVRDEITADLKKEISDLGITPNLAIIRVGDNPDSEVYVRMKMNFAKKIGANAFVVNFPDAKISQEVLLAEIEKLNKDESINGIIIQSPLPAPLDWFEAVEKILPEKDVDGVCPANIKNLAENNYQGIVPATARGVLSLLNYYQIPIKGKKIVVMGRSMLVGSPIAVLMKNNGAEVIVVHSQTENPKEITRTADILIVAIGQPKLVDASYVKSGQVLVDVGITASFNTDGKKVISGDIDFELVKNIVSAISPVPGGVGPMTVASLFQNLVESCEK